MNPLIIIVPIAVIIGSLVYYSYRTKVLKSLYGKKIMLFGPSQSGKTTLFNWMVYNRSTIDYIKTIDEETKTAKKEPFTDKITKITYTDLGGEDTYLVQNGESFYLKNDIVIFIFDAKKYLNMETYRKDTNIRLSFFPDMEKKAIKPILLIASHKDLLSKDEIDGFASFFKKETEKYSLSTPPILILCNLTEKSDIGFVFKNILKTWNRRTK